MAPRANITKSFRALADTFVRAEGHRIEEGKKQAKKWWKR
jgi:hypothetical protein